MALTQIAIKYVNPAKDGKKYGSIKDTNGATYWVPKDMVARFNAGTTVEVPVAHQTWGANSVQVIEGGPSSAASTSSNGTAAPATTPTGAVPYKHDTAKDIQIASIALMKSFIESGKFGLTDLPVLEDACIASAKRIVEASR